jgi:Pyruvate/2-oxoacid:ferredoxin oxidoreductase gamma subunit
MLQIRIHGRGGQGVVTAAELLSVAAFLEGRHARAFPSFGSERTGAPVVAFCRIPDRPIPSAALLGAFAATTGAVTLDSVAAAIRERFAGRVAEGNVAAARAAHDLVRDAIGEPIHA